MYRWGMGAFPVAPEVAAAEFARVEIVEAEARPAAIVERAKAPDAPLHGCFQWDDSEAADQYRLMQARFMLRSLQVQVRAVVEAAGGPPTDEADKRWVRAFVSTVAPDPEDPQQSRRGYVSVVRALVEPERRRSFVADALADLRAAERKCALVKELAGYVEPLRDLIGQMERQEARDEAGPAA